MKISEGTKSTSPWLISVRWYLCLGEVIVIALAFFIKPSTYILATFLLVAIQSGLNLYLASYPLQLSRRRIGGVLVVDSIIFTLLLVVIGGASNPFSIFYITFVGLASIFLGTAWTWCFATLTSALYGGLFFIYIPFEPLEGHMNHHLGSSTPSLHLQGMWLSFSILSFTLAYFFSRLVESKEKAEAEVVEIKLSTLRNEKLLGVTTLAARAAHDLNTPLTTMKLIADDIAKETNLESIHADARAITQQIERCSGVLAQLRSQTGEIQGEFPGFFTSTDLINDVSKRFDHVCAEKIHFLSEPEVHIFTIKLPIVEALYAVLQNSLEAMRGRVGDIEVKFSKVSDATTKIEVSDQGGGFDSSVLKCFGEPFISDKSSDGHLGLGLFLAKAFIERINGSIQLSNSPQGALVTFNIPDIQGVNS